MSPMLSAQQELKKLDPTTYVFPKAPADIAIRLSTLGEKSLVPTSLRNRIIEWLCHDLFRYTLYPQRLYVEAARQLVIQHRVLRDRVGNGYGSWHRALRFKVKFERSKIEDVGVVQENRTKFGRKHAESDTCNDDNNNCAKRISRRPGNLAAMVEDELSIKAHIDSMQKEMAKASPDTEKVRDSMERTFDARRKWIAGECPSAADIFETYPALGAVEEVFLEFQRINGVHPRQLETIAERYMVSLLTLAGKKVETFSMELLTKAETVPDGGWMKTLAFLLTLPRMVKERPSFLKSSAPWFAAYPLVLWTDNIEELGQSAIQVENQIIKAENPAQAVIAAFCLHWVLNFVYEPASRAFYTTLEHLLSITNTKPTGMVVRLLSNLEKVA
ncbi:sterile alpha motif domain-containing protein 3-like [Ixodes scapularis]|uniref:sterile alpha motif domain-containing protein 3-like n=1 Tax=Ixodes scapularis TaxID=6945 RepID=UPI001C38A92E|nr:sterile alpha motif domain-containing protein 3-like [Ixodes scapularis]